MYARVTTASVKPDKFDENVKTMRELLPLIKKQKGFKGGFFLTNRATGKAIIISTWKAEADMTAAADSAALKEGSAKMMPLVVAPPTSEQYEVTIKL